MQVLRMQLYNFMDKPEYERCARGSQGMLLQTKSHKKQK